MPRKKDIRHNLREATVTDHQSLKGYKPMYKQFEILQWERLFTWCASKSSLRSNHLMLRDIKINPSPTSCVLQASISTLHFYVHDSTVRKRLNMYSFNGSVIRKKLLSYRAGAKMFWKSILWAVQGKDIWSCTASCLMQTKTQHTTCKAYWWKGDHLGFILKPQNLENLHSLRLI